MAQGLQNHIELQLLSRIIRTANIMEVLEWGVTHADFQTNVGKELFSHIYSFFNKHDRSIPGPSVLKQLFPTIAFNDDEGLSTVALCQLVRNNRLVVQARQLSEEFLTNLSENPMTALAEMQKGTQILLELGDGSNKDVSFGAAMTRIFDEYCLAEQGLAYSRILWPWGPINEESLGIWPDDYIVLYGRPKSMKTWVLAYMMAYHYSQGLQLLLYTKEMTPDNILKRVAACLAQIRYGELRKGKLLPEKKEDLKVIRDLTQSVQDSQRLICLAGQDVPDGGDTVSWLEAKQKRYGPDVIYIDGVYLMSSGNPRMDQKDNMRVQSISRNIRRMILRNKTPVIATSQANRKAAGHKAAELDELAFSDAFSQDATGAIRIVKDVENTIIMGIAGSREWDLPGIRIGGTPAIDFAFKSLVTEKELKQAKEADVDDKEPPKRRKAPTAVELENAALIAYQKQLDEATQQKKGKK